MDWAQLTEPGQTPFYEAVFDDLDIGNETQLLDVGCGSGLALQIAGKRGAGLTGIDAADALLQIARERNPAADLRRADLEALPFPDRTFDAVTSFNAVQYASDPAAAMREIARVTADRGQVVVLTWGSPEASEMRHVLSAIGSLLPPPPPGAAGPFALSEPGRLEALVESAGLRPRHAADVPTAYEYPDVETAVRAQAATGPAARAIATSGEAPLLEALTTVMRAHVRADGQVRFDNVFRYVVASR